MLTGKWLRRLSLLLVVVLLGGGWFTLESFPLSRGREVIVTVHQGDSMATIAGELHDAGVIASPLVFRMDTLLFGAPLVRAGSYMLRAGSGYFTIKSIIGNLPNVEAIDVVPGLSLHEIAIDLAQDRGNAFGVAFYHEAKTNGARFMASVGFANAPASLEGLIGTGEYILLPGETPSQLLQKMVSSFQRHAAAEGLTPDSTLRVSASKSLNWYQVMTAASIVQKEGYYANNMARVARVILNRLARGGTLQMDSTVLYYYGADGGTVTPAMLKTPTPYNTYLHPGLTPTPLCAVSSTALHDTLHPAAGPWLYFVVIDKNGDEAFASTFAQQLTNEKLARERGL